ncbi:twitching motility protein PilT [Mariprofundus ferrinatatus]|uniref:Twitching motility protein PilT n=1 Tax=Mariprofundus ferrinatatus TaxID=1921087 RepID=A0A2K8L4F0_9PROT|nr:PilT/PilU family type 4a pilus ATPase [Mariprofundus ferrinatatus]ATX82200.1 twitching motility protein PilT [Mariprofundus ferrinatatus]
MDGYTLIDELLLIANKNGASDLIVRTGDRVRMRIAGEIVTIPVEKVAEVGREQVVEMIKHLVRELPKRPDIEQMKHLDFHYSLKSTSHFRIHVMRTNNNFGIVARLIPQQIPGFEALRLPEVIKEITTYRNGLILMAGSAGSGKSTTLAAMLNHIIRQRAVHAVTLEDPIEFRYSTSHQGSVSQREIGTDVESYKQGLIDAMRQTPNIIVAGEARGRDEVQLALEASETGHLVMSTVHATTAIGTMRRVMGSFNSDEQISIRERLAENLRAIIVQKLLPMKNGKGRIVVLEVLVKNAVIKHFILNPDHWSEIPRAMEEGHSMYGSQTFDQHLQQLVEDDLVDYNEALLNAVFPEDFTIRLGRN